MVEEHAVPLNEKFVGRKLELEQFDEAIAPRKGLPKLFFGPNITVKSRVFLPYGIGGIGKTQLSRECLKRAEQAGWATIEIDWDRADTRPTDTTEMMNLIAEKLNEVYGGGSIEEFLKTQKQIKLVNDRIQRLRQENQEKWLSLVDALKDIAGGVGGEEGSGLGSAVSGAGKLVNIGADALARAEDNFTDWLVSTGRIKTDQGMLHKDKEKYLSRILVKAFSETSSTQPLVILFDTCEVLSPKLEEWLRDVIVCPVIGTKKPIITIVSGQHNQYRERSVDFGDGKYRSIKGYADRLNDPPPVSWNISRFADPEIVDYISHQKLEPNQELIDFIQELARGVPYAVQLVTHALLNKGIEYVKENFPPKDPTAFSTEEMVTLVTQRFLRYCLKEEIDLERVRGLAMLRTWDEGGLMAVWRLTEDISPKKILQTLESRYSFILPDRKLHEIVREFVRQDLRTTDEPTARSLGDFLTQHYLPVWDKMTNNISPLAERISEPRWRSSTFDALNALCWHNENAAIEFLTKRVIESMTFDISYASSLLELTNEFRQPPEWCSARSHRLVNILKHIVEGDDREEFKGLEALIKESKGLNLEPEHDVILHVWLSENFSRTGNDKEAMQMCINAEKMMTIDSDASLITRLADQFNDIGWKLGLEHGTAKPSEDAYICLKYAVQLQPENGRQYIGLGVMQIGLGKNKEAAETIIKGIMLGEHKGWAYNSLANAYMQLKQLNDAITAYQRAIELDPKFAIPWNGLGNLYSEQGKTEDAIAAYQKAIELDPKESIPWHGLGNVYAEQGKTEDAITAYQKAVELDPKFAVSWYSLGNRYAEQGKTEDAITAYQKAIELPDLFGSPASAHTLSWYSLGNRYAEQDKTEDAIAAYQKAIELDPKSATPWNGLGNLYSEQGKTEDAIAAYQKAIELDPKYAMPWSSLGNRYAEQGKTEDAIAAYQKAIELDPKYAMPWSSLGNRYAEQGKTEDAIAAYQKAIELDPKYAMPWSSLGNRYAEQGKTEDAIAAYQKAIKIQPENVNFYNNLGMIYESHNQYDKAIEFYKQAIDHCKDDKDRAFSWKNIGDAYRKWNHATEAINAYIKACELDNKVGQYYYELGNMHRRSNNYDDAIKEIEQACLLNPDNANFHYLLGITYAAIQQFAVATEQLNKTIELDPEHGPAHGTLSFYIRKSGDEIDANKHLQIARELMKDEIEYNLSCLEAISGNYEEALELLKVALEKGQETREWARRDPDFANLRNDPRFRKLVDEDERDQSI